MPSKLQNDWQRCRHEQKHRQEICRQLIEKQLITAEPTSVITQKGEKRNGNLRYTIRPIAEALEQYYEQQLIRLHEGNRRQAALKKLAEFDRKHGKSAV